jgi:predicted  nucleic acid-binding Zn-ribbon protein
MPDLKENIKIIEELRKQRNAADEELYLAKLELHQLQRVIDKSGRKERTYSDDVSKEISKIKKQVSELESQLNEINRKLSDLDSSSSKIAGKESYIKYLKDKIETVKARIAGLNQKLNELKDSKYPDDTKIKETQEEIEKLQSLLKELKAALAEAEKELKKLQGQRDKNNAERQKLNKQKEKVTEDINGLKSDLEGLSSRNPEPGNLDGRKEELTNRVNGKKDELSGINNNLINAIEAIYVEQHPKYTVSKLNDNIPFLLFPVKIETRFMTEQRRKELWLRVYPDDIAVYTHEKLLTSSEVDAGGLYWTRTLMAEFAPDEEESRKKAAWNDIASIYTPQRSAWVARETFPLNWQDLLNEYIDKNIIEVLQNIDPDIIDKISEMLPDDGSAERLNTAVVNNNYSEFLVIIENKKIKNNKLPDLIIGTLRAKITFPAHDLTKNSSWSRAPRTSIMPDKFVVMLYQGGEIVDEVVGKTIPDVLDLGPDPLESEKGFKTENDKLVFGDSFAWMSDFEKAVAAGMGFKIPLKAPYDTRGFDKILVLGLYLSADETRNQTEIEELIDNHHYSPKGFSIVPQGTPTNNTESDGSGYKSNDPFSDTSYFVETGDPLFVPDNPDYEDCNGKRLAEALGIEYAPLQYIQNSEGKDFLEATAMNKALYPSTLGYYTESLLDPVFDEESKDQIRNFFTTYVTGRGPISAIRVGDQPYGILLTSDFSKWKWGRLGEVYSSSFLNKTHQVIKYFQDEWDRLMSQLMYVGKPGADPSDVLMNVLGLQPGSASFYQRVGYSSEYLKNLDDFQSGGRYFGDMFANFFKTLAALGMLTGFGYKTTNDNGTSKKLPQLLKLIYQHYQTRLDSANLIDDNPLSETNLIKYYDEAGKKNYINWLSEADTVEKLEKQDFGGAPAPTALLYLKLRHALLLQLHKESSRWLINRKIPVEHTMHTQNFYNILPQSDLTKWEVMKAGIGTIEPSNTYKNLSVGNYFLGVGRFEESDAEFFNKIKNSLEILAQMQTARLERCFTEHIDLCTYRLDAWQTALFSLRLKEQRNLGGEINERKKGIYMGAYGWVENVKPEERTTVNPDTVPEKLRPEKDIPVYEYSDNGGFVHAPSLNHASAAALLRSAYLSHATKDDPDLMAVNLSSERVRRALFILEGIRNGQLIEALLGYQFERGMHDRSSENPALNLNLYIYNFREAFVIKQNKIKQQGSDDTSEETIPPYSVLDGLTLAESTKPYPYDVKGLEGLNSDQINAIKAEKDRLSDSLDAIKDLLISESAYQVVQGNFDRTGAVLNSMKDIQVPPEIDVINTPRSSQFTFTNRVTLHFENLDPANPASNPWAPVQMTPRAIIEPGLNKWLGESIGSPDNIICRVAHLDEEDNELGSENTELGDLELQAIDFMYLIGNELGGGATEIETRIAYLYKTNHGLDDTAKIKIEFSKPEGLAGKITMAQILPFVKMLKSLIIDSKALDAEDFEPSSKESTKDKNNPKGYDLTDIAGRVQDAYDALNNVLNELKQIDISATINAVVVSKLVDAAAELQNNNLSFADVSFIFNNTEVNELQIILNKISNYGVSDAFPKLVNALEDETKIILLEQGVSILRILQKNLDGAKLKIDEAVAETDSNNKVKLYIEAAKFIFGGQFNILPLFYYNNEADIISSNNDRNQLLKYAKNNLNMEFPSDEWLNNTAHVRQKLQKWEMVRTLCETLSDQENESLPVQLPYRDKDSWLAVEFPETDELTNKPFQIMHDTISIVAHGASAFSAGSKQSGLLIDDWTEVIPAEDEVTGITFNYNQPNAVPPQALLLAVTPEVTGSWSWDELVGTLNDTLQRAKRRAIEPMILDKSARQEINTMLPAVIGEFNQYDLNVSLDYSINIKFIAEKVAMVNESLKEK